MSDVSSTITVTPIAAKHSRPQVLRNVPASRSHHWRQQWYRIAVAEHLTTTYHYRVAILDVNGDRGRAEATRLNNGGYDNCLFLEVDVTNYGLLSQAFQQTLHWGGKNLNLVFANAGIADTDSVYKEVIGVDQSTGLPPPVNLKTIDVNLLAVVQGVNLARFFFQQNTGQLGGKIVVTSSCLGLYPLHALPLYTASKHALVGFVRATAPVLAGMRITINAILPALIDTGLMPEEHWPLWDREQLTPMDTALRAIDLIIRDPKNQVNGETIEVAADELVLAKAPEFSTPNMRWLVAQNVVPWQSVAAPLLPKSAGQNVTVE